MNSGTMNCDTCREHMLNHALGLLEQNEAAAMESHINSCAKCRTAMAAEHDRLSALDTLTEPDTSPYLVQKTMKKLTETPEARAKGFRIPSLTYAFLGITVALIVFLVPSLFRAREASRKSSSANNLKQLSIVFKMYSNESSGGRFPPPVRVGNAFVPDLRVIYPEYLTDPEVFINPNLPDGEEKGKRLTEALEADPPNWEVAHAIVAENYTYLPWAIEDEEDLEILASYYPDLDQKDLNADLIARTSSLYRVRDGVERFFITDINNPGGSATAHISIPVLMETLPPANTPKNKKSYNVLYLDGHVELIKYGTKFPVIPETAELFNPEQ